MRSTRVRATVLRRNLEPLLALLANVTWEPALRAGDFSKLKRRAEAALTARLDDDQALGAVCFREALFGEHPYGRTLSGHADSLARIGIQQVKDFYARNILKGAFIVGVFRRRGAKPRCARSLRPIFRRPDALERRALTCQRHAPAVAVTSSSWTSPSEHRRSSSSGLSGPARATAILFPLLVSNTAFGGTFSGPLMQQVRGVRGWSYGAYSRLLHSTQRDAWYMSTAPAAEYSADCAALQLDLLERWVEGGTKNTDLRFAQRYLINSHLL